MSRVSVVVPVKDGERYLAELLDALAREGRRRGARDRLGLARSLASRSRARRACELLEIEPGGVRPRPHPQPRRGAHRGRADLLPHPGRDARARAGSPPTARRSRSTRASAPPTARTCRAPDTSPMIARELTRVLRGASPPDGGAGASSAGASRPSSRTSTPATRAPAGRRSASATSPTPRTRRSARDLLAAGWAKVYHPGAAVLHAHDYGPLEFMRRYFDEYRGLRETTGHVEPFALRGAARQVAGADAALDG